jgi:hypothetical protein
MKKNMRRKGSERKLRSTRRRKWNGSRHSSPTTQAVATIPDSETNSPNAKSPREREFGEETSSAPNTMQSGGLQGTAGTKASTSESIAELFEEGQDLETELVHGVENASDVHQYEIRTHQASREEAPEYRNRNRI